MFLGTYRLYRTDNAEAPNAGDVTWDADQRRPDQRLHRRRARTAHVAASSRAIGVADGGDGVYAGTDEGWIQVSPDAVTSDSPDLAPRRRRARCRTGRSTRSPSTARTGASPTRRTAASARRRPSNTRPRVRHHRRRRALAEHHRQPARRPGQQRRARPGRRRTRSTSAPTSARSSRPTAATAGSALGSGMPKVAVWQLDYDATNGVLAAGTHGRGAYTLTNRSADARARRVEGRRRHAGRPGQHHPLHDDASRTSATPPPPASP